MADDDAASEDEDAAVEGEIVTSTAAVTPTSSTTPPTTYIAVQLGVSATYASQLPPAAEIRELEGILPGTLNRLLSLQEKVAAQTDVEQAHRHEMDTADSQLRSRGQLIAAGAFSLGMVTTVILAAIGDGVAAAAVGGTTVLGSVTVFVTGRVFGGTDGAGEAE